MTDHDITKAVAELDGWTNVQMLGGSGFWYYNFDEKDRDAAEHGTLKGAHSEYQLPKYLTSRDAIVPVIEKFVNNYHNQLKFYLALQKIVFVEDASPYSIEVLCICATPSQLCEALLRATGKWKD